MSEMEWSRHKKLIDFSTCQEAFDVPWSQPCLISWFGSIIKAKKVIVMLSRVGDGGDLTEHWMKERKAARV